jgi:hypothetical protein
VFITVSEAGEYEESGIGHDVTFYDASYNVLERKSREIDLMMEACGAR